MSAGKSQEQAFNYALANALCECRSGWSSDNIQVEQSGVLTGENARKRPDILICPDMINPVIIESAYAGTPNIDGDAISRLGVALSRKGGRVLTAIALRVPANLQQSGMNVKELTHWLQQGGKFEYAVYSLNNAAGERGALGYEYRFPDGAANSAYLHGDVWELADIVELAATPAAVVEKVVNEAVERVRQVAGEIELQLSAAAVEKIAAVVGQPAGKFAMQVACCIWLNAMVLHGRLAGAGVKDAAGREFDGPWATASATDLIDTWKRILVVNYKSVFRPALLSLKMLDDKLPVLSNLVAADLSPEARNICALRLGVIGDVAADMYPALAADRKDTAAFYTKPEVAELLSVLTLAKLPAERVRGAKVADFACGTGTLLKSAYRGLRRAVQQLDGGQTDMKAFHKHNMEEALHAADIQQIATHLTAAGLAGMAPEHAFSQSKIICTSVRDGDIGSLNLLDDDSSGLLDMMELSAHGVGVDGGAARFEVGDGAMDVCILNPPYTGARGGHELFAITGLSAAERERSINKLREAMRKTPFASSQAGLGSVFTGLAHNKLRAGGVLSFVLPLTAAAQSGWRAWRENMIKNYDGLIAISALQSFSADTGMREMLICGTKRGNGSNGANGARGGIALVNLRHSPKNMMEAYTIGKLLAGIDDRAEGNLRIGDAIIATWTRLCPDNGAPWGALGGDTYELARAAAALDEGCVFVNSTNLSYEIPLPHTPLEKHCGVGKTHHLIGHLAGNQEIGVFKFYPRKAGARVQRSHPALWQTQSTEQTRLLCEPTHYGEIHDAERVLHINESKSRLFVARNLNLNSQAVAAAITAEDCHGGRAWTALLCPDAASAAYCLWLNSIFGLVSKWYNGGMQHKGRAMMQIKDLSQFKAPAFSDDTPAAAHARRVAARELKKVLQKPLLPCAYAWMDPARKMIDAAVTKMLKLDLSEPELQELRVLFCTDPSVNGGKHDILEKLRQDNLLP